MNDRRSTTSDPPQMSPWGARNFAERACKISAEQPRTGLGAIPNAPISPFRGGLLRILLAVGQARSAWRLRAVPRVDSGL